MDAMDSFPNCYPEGLLPTGYPTICLPANNPMTMTSSVSGLSMPSQATADFAPAGEEAFSGDEMEFLERILREVHLSDGQHPQPEQHLVTAPAGGAQWRPGANTPDAAASAARPSVAAGTGPAAAEAPGGRAGSEPTVAQWAEELVQRLQGCASTEEASARCAELLEIYRQQSGQNANPQRLQKLQSANSVLLRGLRGLSRRHKEVSQRAQLAEEANAKLAAELARCQEALHASERAKGALQYHLQLSNIAPGTACGGM